MSGNAAFDLAELELRKNLEQGVELSGNAAFDLAELELENFTHNSKKNTLARQLASLKEMLEESDQTLTRDDSHKGRGGRSIFRMQQSSFGSDLSRHGSGIIAPNEKSQRIHPCTNPPIHLDGRL